MAATIPINHNFAKEESEKQRRMAKIQNVSNFKSSATHRCKSPLLSFKKSIKTTKIGIRFNEV